MPDEKVVMKTIHGHSNYATNGIDVVFDDLSYVKDAAVLQVGSNITGVMTVQAASQTLSVAFFLLLIVFRSLNWALRPVDEYILSPWKYLK
jgi:uncharacterized protein YsxB (DUF464 family)